MFLIAAGIFVLFAFISLKLFEGVLKIVFHVIGWIIAIALVMYWWHEDHATAAPAPHASAYEWQADKAV